MCFTICQRLALMSFTFEGCLHQELNIKVKNKQTNKNFLSNYASKNKGKLSANKVISLVTCIDLNQSMRRATVDSGTSIADLVLIGNSSTWALSSSTRERILLLVVTWPWYWLFKLSIISWSSEMSPSIFCKASANIDAASLAAPAILNLKWSSFRWAAKTGKELAARLACELGGVWNVIVRAKSS